MAGTAVLLQPAHRQAAAGGAGVSMAGTAVLLQLSAKQLQECSGSGFNGLNGRAVATCRLAPIMVGSMVSMA